MAKFAKIQNALINFDKVLQINIFKETKFKSKDVSFEVIKVLIIYENQLSVTIEIDTINRTEYVDLLNFIDSLDVCYHNSSEKLLNDMLKNNTILTVNQQS